MLYGIIWSQEIIRDKRRQRMSLKEEPKDFVDAFLQEIDKQEDEMLTGNNVNDFANALVN